MKVPLLLGLIGHCREYPRFLNVFFFSFAHRQKTTCTGANIGVLPEHFKSTFLNKVTSISPISHIGVPRLGFFLCLKINNMYRLYWYSKNYTLKIVRTKKKCVVEKHQQQKILTENQDPCESDKRIAELALALLRSTSAADE